MSNRLKEILQEIIDFKRTSIDRLGLTKQDLLTKDENGVYFLEYLIKNNISLYCVLNQIVDDPVAIYIFLKNNKCFNLDFDKIDEKVLFTEISNNERLIDYIIKNKRIYLSKTISKINDVSKLVELSKEYNDNSILAFVNQSVLMSKYDNNENFLQYLINKEKVEPILLLSIPNDKNFIIFLVKNNMYKYLKRCDESSMLLEIENGKTLLEILIEKGYKIDFHISNIETIKFLQKINKMDLITSVSNEILLKPAKMVLDDNSLNDETFLEYLLDNGNNLRLNDSDNNNINKILYKKERPDLLATNNLDELLVKIDDSNTYLDYILECIKSNKFNGVIPKFDFDLDDINDIAKYYLIFAKHDMMNYIKPLKEDDLLKKIDGNTLLELLLNTDSSLTVNKILSERVKYGGKVNVILKAKGLLNDNDVAFLETDSFIMPNYEDEYVNELKYNTKVGPLPNEANILLNKLQQLFFLDNQSDKELITTLVNGYRQALFVNYEFNLEEIKRLIEIKENNYDIFYYKKVKSGAFYNKNDGCVYCDSNFISVLFHETGHAMHDYLTNMYIPSNYKEIKERLNKDHELLKKTEEYVKDKQLLEDKIISLVNQKYDSYFKEYYSDERKNSIKNMLDKTKEEKLEKYKELGIPEEQLSVVLDGMYTVDEFIENQKQIFIGESLEFIFRKKYATILSTCDVLDAIYDGKLFNNELKNEKGEKIKCMSGHGINYYYGNYVSQFEEMIAQFAAISKDNDSKEKLNDLKNIIGDELYNLISGFYYRNIINNTVKIDEEKKGKGR